MSRRRFEIRDLEQRIRRNLEPDHVGVGRRRALLVELGDVYAPPLERTQRARGAEVRPGRHGDGRAWPEERERERRGRTHPGGEEERRTAVQLAERALGSRARGVCVPLVEELLRLAPLVVRPDRRAIERAHDSSLLSGAVEAPTDGEGGRA